MANEQADIVVIGGGIGGYSAAIRASQLGKKVVIVEQDKLGGTCLHRGCIPSKSLLRSAEVLAALRKSGEYGISVQGVSVDFAQVQERKQRVVEQLYKGLSWLIKQHRIEVIAGKGRIIGPSIFSPRSGAVAVEKADGETITLVPEHVIIATGSRPRRLPGLDADGEHVLTSDEALEMKRLPRSMLIVGGGIIGVEWASLLNDFGVEVTIVESAERLLPHEDEDISRELERIFKKRKINVFTQARLLPERLRSADGQLLLKVVHQDKESELSAEKVLVAVGRQANIEGIGLENTDIRLAGGFIQTNEFMQTTEAHIYAVGDVAGGYMLAHAAAHEGMKAAEHIAGREVLPVDPNVVPRCVYTRTEVAAVGLTEKEAREKGHEIKIGRIPFRAIGKSLIYGETDGFVKVIADRVSNDILGVHMIGPHVTDYISEAALARVLDAAPWEVGQTVHPHPTLSEIIGESMLAVDGLAVAMI